MKQREKDKADWEYVRCCATLSAGDRLAWKWLSDRPRMEDGTFFVTDEEVELEMEDFVQRNLRHLDADGNPPLHPVA